MKTINLRKRKNKKFITLYLDIYENGVRTYENLFDMNGKPLRLIPSPRNNQEKSYNRIVNQEAKRLTSLREANLMTGTFSNATMSDEKNKDFVVYMRSLTQNRHSTWRHACNILEEFCKKLLFTDITESKVIEIKNFFIKREKSLHSAKTRFGRVRSALRMAYEDDLLPKDFTAKVKNISAGKSEKPYLEPYEIEKIMQAPLKCIYQIKEAALFAYYTGLRVSDLFELQYKHIIGEKQNVIEKVIFKNRRMIKKPSLIPIPDIAKPLIEALGNRNPDEYVFTLGQERVKTPEDLHNAKVYITRVLKRLAQKAGIEKKIGIHTFRYSHATELEANEVDRELIKDNLGHQNSMTTSIYTKVKISKQLETVNKKITPIEVDFPKKPKN